LEKERAELLKRIDLERLKVNLLVNNAGFGSIGRFSESSLEWEEKMVEVNCKAPLHLMRHFLPIMSERFRSSGTRSSIINVSSIASFQSVPYMATYAATKAFLTSITLAVQAEVAKNGIQLLALCPGPTESEFHKVVGLKKKVEVVPSMSAEAVVREALESVGAARSIKVNGTRNVIMVALNRFVPRMTAARIGERLLRPYLERID
jgi:short-subunit dehydrogenase